MVTVVPLRTARTSPPAPPMAAAAPSAALVAFAECFSGGVGGWFSSFVLFPLDVVKTRMQGGEEGSALQVAGRLYKRGGLVALWKGGHARGLQSLIEKVGYFYSYSFMKTLIERSGPMGVALQLTVGYFVRCRASTASQHTASRHHQQQPWRAHRPRTHKTTHHTLCWNRWRPPAARKLMANSRRTGCTCRSRCLSIPSSSA